MSEQKKFDAVGLGELLIDFTQNAISEQGNPLMEANPGGAVCNVISMLTKLGHSTAFIGKVGDDIWGRYLIERVGSLNIDTSSISVDKKANTTLAFVKNSPDGDREFSFYRSPGADMMLSEDDVDENLIKSSRLMQFGTLSMTHDTCRAATCKAIKIAKENSVLLSFDPNIRESLWSDMELARSQVEYGLKYCDILKISDNELLWFAKTDDYDSGIKYLQENYNISLIVLSLGKNGSRAYTKSSHAEAPAFINNNTVDTTGAGDTFGACVAHYVLKNGLREYSSSELKEMLVFANAAASIITTRKGALAVMPGQKEIEFFLKNHYSA